MVVQVDQAMGYSADGRTRHAVYLRVQLSADVWGADGIPGLSAVRRLFSQSLGRVQAF
ncbi:hypothetical protein D3C84_1163400 [compost metagenome]